nr:hypothetical protein ACMD2_17387 [Ipomoea batatas]
MESLMPRSRQASSFPHGCQLSGLQPSGCTINQVPGLDLATQSQPVDGTNGVVIKAAATAEPERTDYQLKRTNLLSLNTNTTMGTLVPSSGVASGDDTKGTDVVCTGKPGRRISHTQGGESAWIPVDFVSFKDFIGTLKPSDPTDTLMKA